MALPGDEKRGEVLEVSERVRSQEKKDIPRFSWFLDPDYSSCYPGV